MKKTKKWTAILLVFSIGLLVFASTDTKIKQQEELLADVQRQLRELDKEQRALQSQLSEVEKQAKAIESDMRVIDAKIMELSQEIEATEQAIEIKTRELAEAEREVAYQNDRMKKRLRTMYKSGNFSYVEILLGADDFADMMTRVDKIQMLFAYDQDTLTKLIEIKQFVSDTKIALEEKERELQEYKADQAAQKVALQTKLSELNAVKAKFEDNLEALERLEGELADTAEKVTAIIKQLKTKQQFVGGVMKWPLPLSYTYISSYYGGRIHPITGKKDFHMGIDMPAPSGTPVYAALAGRVIYANWLGSYGRAVIIDHGGGIVTLYAHNSSIVTSEGQTVGQGDVVAKVGTTGSSTGNHLHFEVRKNGSHTNPLDYVKSR